MKQDRPQLASLSLGMLFALKSDRNELNQFNGYMYFLLSYSRSFCILVLDVFLVNCTWAHFIKTQWASNPS